MKLTKEVQEYLDGLNDTLHKNTICKTRTIYSLNWYSKKANFYKYTYYTLSLINIVVPLSSTVIISFFPSEDILVAVLSALASFAASLLSLLGAKDKWTNYRNGAEFLKSQYTLYLSHAAPYNTIESDSLYMTTIETQMQTFHANWMQSQKTSKGDDSEMEF